MIKAKNKNKNNSTYLKLLTREVLKHIKNAQGGPLISVFGVVSSFNRDFSFASNFSRQKNNENIAICLYKFCTQTDNHLVMSRTKTEPEDRQGAVYKIKCCDCKNKP